MTTRRAFVKKAKYVVPAIWVLGAAPEHAFASGAPASGTCFVSGTPCMFDSDCCSDNCEGSMMDNFCDPISP